MIRVAKLSPIEKMAVDLIRGCRSARLGSGECREFLRLAREAKRAGMVISVLDSPYLGEDEATLLGCLALLQRQRAMLAVELNPALVRHLTRGAARLTGHGITLDYRNVARISQRAPVRRKRAPGRRTASTTAPASSSPPADLH